MSLTFNMHRDGAYYVTNSEGDAQYILKATHNPHLSGGVYDDLGLSQLVGIEETDSGFSISAFDTPMGVFAPAEDCILRMQGEGLEISKSADGYVFSRNGEKLADIFILGTEVKFTVQNSGQAIMIIAAALIALEYDRRVGQRTAVKTPSRASKRENIGTKALHILSVIYVAARNKLKNLKIADFKQAASKMGSALSSLKLRVTGRALVVSISVLAVLLATFISGLVITAVKTDDIQNMQWTTATVNVDESGKTTADFKIGNYGYNITLNKNDYQKGDTFSLYYTKNPDGTLNEYYMAQPSAKGYISISVISAFGILIMFIYMFYGLPFSLSFDYKRLSDSFMKNKKK